MTTQDDGLVGVLKNILVGCTKNREIKKVTGSRDDNSVCVVMNSLRQDTSSSEAVAYGVEDLTVQKREAPWDQSVGVEIEILSTRARAARLTWQQKGHG
jgi:hypothetical protein